MSRTARIGFSGWLVELLNPELAINSINKNKSTPWMETVPHSEAQNGFLVCFTYGSLWQPKTPLGRLRLASDR